MYMYVPAAYLCSVPCAFHELKGILICVHCIHEFYCVVVVSCFLLGIFIFWSASIG